MNNHENKALELFSNGYNCCQSVLIPYCDSLGMDKQTAVKLSSSFGGGIGGLGEACGALCGVFMVMGLKHANFDPTDKALKDAHKKILQSLAEEFKTENGSIICRELVKDVPEQDRHSYCSKFVKYATNLLDNQLTSE